MLQALVGDRFELLEEAGKGGMGTVYRALDQVTKRVVAVKVLRDAGAESASRFEHEARVLGDITHPHVVQYVTHGLNAAGEPFLAMEWLDGQSLAEKLASGPLGVDETLDLGRRVASALALAHSRGIVHRDIKPTNLFLPGGDIQRVKLLDFGIARLNHATTMLTKTGMLIGTPGYMAPEQARGDRTELDARADVFSLGCVLFECLTGKPAFHGIHVIALLAKLLMEEPPHVRELCPEVPRAVDDLIHSMLSKDPDLRPANGEVVVAALDRLGSSEHAGGQRPPLAPEALTHTEKRLVSVVAVVPSTSDKIQESGVTLARAPITGKLLAELRRAVQPFGAKVEEIANGMLIALLVGTGPATDQAAIAARCALRMQLILPHSQFVLLTRRGESTGRLPVGEVFDSAASLIEKVDPDNESEGMLHVDDVTRALLDARFEILEENGRLTLRGERDVGAEARTLLGRPSPFVGRDRELRALLDAVEEAIDEGRARVVIITGDPGCGKSRLRYEFVERLRSTQPNLVISIGRGDSMGAGSAFALLGSAFRSSLGISADEPTEIQRNKLVTALKAHFSNQKNDYMLGFLGEMIGIPFVDESDPRVHAARHNPAIMADQIQSAYVELVRAVTTSQPILLVLEDLHWGDAPSIKLVDAALRELVDLPFIVVAFARPEVFEVFPKLWSGRSAQSIALGGLTRRGAESLVKSMLGDSIPGKTITTIVERANGNAFYLEELIRAVSEGRGDELPETILGMIEARLAALSSDARRILRAASILGETFWKAGIEELLPDDVSSMNTTHLENLCSLEFITRRPVSRFSDEVEYGFRHALVRESAYAMLTDRDKSLGHDLAGNWLLKTGELDPMVLAEHFERGTTPSKASVHYADAAVQAMRGGDIAVSIARAEKGLSRCADDHARHRLLDVLITVTFLAAQYAKCYEYTQAMLADSSLDGPLHTRALGYSVTSAVFLGRLDVFADCVPKLLTRTPTTEDAATVANGLYGVFIMLIVAGQKEDALPSLRKLEEIATTFRGKDLLAAAWGNFAQLFAARELHNNLHAAREYARDSAAEFEAAGARQYVAITHAHLGLSFLQLGLFAQAETLLDGVLATHDAGKLATTYAMHYKTLLLVEREKWDEAFALSGALVKEALEANDFVLLWCARLSAATILIAWDKLDDADAVLDELGEANAFLPFLRARFSSLRSEIRRRQGHFAEAVRLAEEALKVGRAGPRYNYGEDPLRLRIALALHAQGDLAAARAAIREARDDLLARAEKIVHADERRAFLNEIRTHARTLELAREWLESNEKAHM